MPCQQGACVYCCAIDSARSSRLKVINKSHQNVIVSLLFPFIPLNCITLRSAKLVEVFPLNRISELPSPIQHLTQIFYAK